MKKNDSKIHITQVPGELAQYNGWTGPELLKLVAQLEKKPSEIDLFPILVGLLHDEEVLRLWKRCSMQPPSDARAALMYRLAAEFELRDLRHGTTHKL